MVTCRPEMLIRWVIPVRAKACHKPGSIACWSPTASAIRMPAYGASGSTARKRSRMVSRSISTA
jgi:hypothetical protein